MLTGDVLSPEEGVLGAGCDAAFGLDQLGDVAPQVGAGCRLLKEERLKSLRDDARRDDGVSFEQTGIDYLCCDLCRHRDYAEMSRLGVQKPLGMAGSLTAGASMLSA